MRRRLRHAKYHNRPSARHHWCSFCGEKSRHLWNMRVFDGSEGKELMRCDLCCMVLLGDEVKRLRAHRCEVGLEDPDAMLAHLQALSPEDKAELETMMTRRRR